MLFLAVLQAVFFEAMSKQASIVECFKPSWLSMVAKAPKALRYRTQKNGIRNPFLICLVAGFHALATATHGPTGIVPTVFSSNILDKSMHHHASSITHWNIHRDSAGLEAFLLRLRSLSGGFAFQFAQHFQRFKSQRSYLI